MQLHSGGAFAEHCVRHPAQLHPKGLSTLFRPLLFWGEGGGEWTQRALRLRRNLPSIQQFGFAAGPPRNTPPRTPLGIMPFAPGEAGIPHCFPLPPKSGSYQRGIQVPLCLFSGQVTSRIRPRVAWLGLCLGSGGGEFQSGDQRVGPGQAGGSELVGCFLPAPDLSPGDPCKMGTGPKGSRGTSSPAGEPEDWLPVPALGGGGGGGHAQGLGGAPTEGPGMGSAKHRGSSTTAVSLSPAPQGEGWGAFPGGSGAAAAAAIGCLCFGSRWPSAPRLASLFSSWASPFRRGNNASPPPSSSAVARGPTGPGRGGEGGVQGDC